MARNLPETITSIKAKLNSGVEVATSAMTKNLDKVLNDDEVSPKVKLKVAQDYLALYLQLINAEHSERDARESLKNKKLNNLIKQDAVDKLDKPDSTNEGATTVNQSKFSPSMVN